MIVLIVNIALYLKIKSLKEVKFFKTLKKDISRGEKSSKSKL